MKSIQINQHHNWAGSGFGAAWPLLALSWAETIFAWLLAVTVFEQLTQSGESEPELIAEQLQGLRQLASSETLIERFRL